MKLIVAVALIFILSSAFSGATASKSSTEQKRVDVIDREVHISLTPMARAKLKQSKILRITGIGNAADGSDWDTVDYVDVEGAHASVGGETCNDKDYRINGADSSKYTWKHDQQVVSADHDTHWEFHTVSPQEIYWHICASNCVFSCDEIKMYLDTKVVPI